MSFSVAGPAVAVTEPAPSAGEYTFVRTVPDPTPQFSSRATSEVRVSNDGIAQTQLCDGSQVLQSSSADGPGTLNLSFARQVQSQASVSVTAGVSASVTAEVGLSATFQGFGATGKLGTTIGTSLSATFGYNVLDSTTVTSSYTTPIPAGESWTVSAYPAFAKYNYSIFANSWKNGAEPIAAGQLLSPVGYCYKTAQLKKLAIANGFAAPDSATSGAAVRYQPSGSNALSGWSYSPDGSIRLGGQNLCLDSTSGGSVILYTCHGHPNQRWTQDGQALVNAQYGTCLDLPGGVASPGKQLIAYPCNGTAAQKWNFYDPNISATERNQIAPAPTPASPQGITTGPQVDNVTVIVPGHQGNVGASYQNLKTTEARGNVTLTLQAPSNSKFLDNQLYGTSFQSPGAGPSMKVILTRDECFLSNANKTLTCKGSIAVPAAPAGGSGWLDIQAPVVVDSATGLNGYFNDGRFEGTQDGGISAGTTILQYRTPW